MDQTRDAADWYNKLSKLWWENCQVWGSTACGLNRWLDCQLRPVPPPEHPQPTLTFRSPANGNLFEVFAFLICSWLCDGLGRKGRVPTPNLTPYKPVIMRLASCLGTKYKTYTPSIDLQYRSCLGFSWVCVWSRVPVLFYHFRFAQ